MHRVTTRIVFSTVIAAMLGLGFQVSVSRAAEAKSRPNFLFLFYFPKRHPSDSWRHFGLPVRPAVGGDDFIPPHCGLYGCGSDEGRRQPLWGISSIIHSTRLSTIGVRD